MPANRSHIDRDVKRDEILNVADALLLRDGYDATTIASIARRVGVTSNAVYWYFPSKDDLLAAVLERRQNRAIANLDDRESGELDEQVLAMLAHLDEVATLTASVHERAAHSTAVAEMHDRFHLGADGCLKANLRDAGLAPDDADRTAQAIMAIVEGIHLHEPDRDSAARDEFVLWVLKRLTGGTGDRVMSHQLEEDS
jgi:AcrR family transcriptional regulator